MNIGPETEYVVHKVAPTVELLAADDGRAYIRVAFEGSDTHLILTGGEERC